MPSEPIRTVTFRIPELLNDELSAALAKWGHESEGIEKVMTRLLAHATKPQKR
jgi:hypothetical protein